MSTLAPWSRSRTSAVIPTRLLADAGSQVELVRFYVDRDYHGRGIASRMMDVVRDAAIALGAEVLWLGVWEHNPRAIAFYKKCGFTDVGTQDFWMGPERQHDRVMALRC